MVLTQVDIWIQALKEFNERLRKGNPNHAPAGTPEGGQFTSGTQTDEERVQIAVAVATYQSTLFDAINNELRYDKPDKYKEIIKNLDKASTDVTNDVLYRGFNSDFTKEILNKHGIKDLSNLAILKSKLIGQSLTDKGFMSTTRHLNVAGDFARDVGKGATTVMQIDGKKTGIEVTKYINNYRARQEHEFIIKRNTKVKITDVSVSKTGKLILYTSINN